MRTVLLVTTALIGFIPAAASAQVQATANPAPSEAVSAASAPDQGGLGEIIVTAQRRQESSQRAAIPLNVLQGGALLASGVTQADRLNNLAPALSIEPTSTGNLIFIRGVGNFTVVPSSDPAVAFNYDGVYVGRPTSTTGVFYDLDRVEILKGPQGILYGRNATGGAINVLPAQPKIGELGGYVSATYGNYNTINAEGAINLPIGETGAFRLSAMTANHDGYLSDGTSDQKTYGFRAQLKAELTPDLTVRVAADFSHDGGLGSGIDYQGIYAGSVANFIPSGIPFGTGVTSASSQAFREAVVIGPLGNHLPPLLPTPFVNNSFYGVNAEIDYKTSAGTLTIIPAWRDSKLNYLSDAGAFLYRDVENDNQYSLEARFAGTRIGPFDYQVGGYFFDERIHADTELTVSNLGNYITPTYGTKSYAGFGRLTLNLLDDRLRLVGGARYTEDDKTFTTTQIGAVIACVVTVAGRPSCPRSPTVPLFDDPSQLGYAFPARGGPPMPIIVGGIPTGALSVRTDTAYNTGLDNHKLTYRGAAEFDVAPRSLVYGSVETGYRSGGFSAATGFLTYQPETITAYTIGTKNRFFGNKLQLNAEGFIWDYKNQQVNHVGIDLNGQTANFTQNIGSSRIKGVEVDGKLLVTPTTLLAADVQYLDAKQQNFVYSQGPGAAPITGCAVSIVAGAAPYLINCSGLPSYNSPKWTLNFSGQQTIKLGDFELVLSADTQHRSSRYIGFAYLPQQLVGSTWTTNAQVQFGPASEKWSIAAYLRNIENDRIPIYSSLHPTANFLIDGTTAPRTFGVRVSGKF